MWTKPYIRLGLFFGIIVVVSNFCLVAQALLFQNEFATGDRARFDNYRLYFVEMETEEQVNVFQELLLNDSYIFFLSPRRVDFPVSILVSAHKRAEFIELANSYKLNYRLLTENFQDKVDRTYRDVRPKNTNPRFMNWRSFYHLETRYAWLELQAKNHPETVTLLNIGKSTEGVPIKGVRIAFDDGDESINKTTVFIESGLRGRDWIVPATATFLIDRLLNSRRQEVRQLARSVNWIIITDVNPDGIKYTFESNRLWLRNRAVYGNCRGVDLNRNFPEFWNISGENTEPCAYNYKGPSPGSEVETQVLMSYLKENAEKERIKTYISLRAFAQIILFPYAHSPERIDNYDDLNDIARLAAERVKRTTGSDYSYGSVYEHLFPVGGLPMDWAYTNLNLSVAYILQLRGPLDSDAPYVLPASEIIPTGREAGAAIIVIIQEALKRNLYN